MKAVYAAGIAGCVCAVAFGLFFTFRDAPASPETGPGRTAPPGPSPVSLIAHEWGTFTSFSGSDGVAVGFRPNNLDLPPFVYHQQDNESKGGYLMLTGKVSMETPVIYFYANRDTRVSVGVNFPRGWITEWYPVAATEPAPKGQNRRTAGQSIRWDVKVLAQETPGLPRDESKNHYYDARETDAAFVQAEDPRVGGHQGGVVVQREKFLFYRGVGTFGPPVTVRSLGEGKVRVLNANATPVTGLVLVTVREGKVAFKPLGEIAGKGELTSSMPTTFADSTELADTMVKQLTAAGLYEKEAKAMVKTWTSAWFGEEGNRLMYMVPRATTDELLPITVDPKPTELVRVLVGRHDFVTPEQEKLVEQQIRRQQAAQNELNAAETELQKVGRFVGEARQLAAQRLEKGGNTASPR
jgi:hypothetical protein